MMIKENLNHINVKIEKTSKQWSRGADDVNLIAVSKGQPQEKIQFALNAGHRLFGENKVQEAFAHWAEIKPLYPDLKLHLIGALQTNKIKDALKIFDCIHTLDREKLVHKLNEELIVQNRHMDCFIQVNIGEEEQKSGVLIQDLPKLLNFCQDKCKQLNIIGLMCIPPEKEPPALYFALLQKLAKQHNLTELSMGMSADYERAIALGATYIRVGSGIFGARD